MGEPQDRKVGTKMLTIHEKLSSEIKSTGKEMPIEMVAHAKSKLNSFYALRRDIDDDLTVIREKILNVQ